MGETLSTKQSISYQRFSGRVKDACTESESETNDFKLAGNLFKNLEASERNDFWKLEHQKPISTHSLSGKMQRRLRGGQVDSRLRERCRKNSSKSIEHRDQLTQQQWFHLWVSWSSACFDDDIGVWLPFLLHLFWNVGHRKHHPKHQRLRPPNILNAFSLKKNLLKVLWFPSASCSSPSGRSGRWQQTATAARALRLLKFHVWAPSCCIAAPLIVCVDHLTRCKTCMFY